MGNIPGNKMHKKLVFDSLANNQQVLEDQETKKIAFHLKNILKDRDLCFIFLQWLQEQHCEENLLFYLEVELFKNPKETPEEILIFAANEIWEKYIPDNSEQAVNVDSDLIQDMLIKKSHGQVDRTFYDSAQEHIYHVKINNF